MTNRDYDLLEEEFNEEVPEKFKHTKKKKTWEQLQKDKERQMNKKKWLMKRRKARNENDIK